MPGPWSTKVWLGCGSTAQIMKSPAQSLLSVHLITELCPTVCNPMDCSPPGSSVQGETPGKNTTVGCHGLLQGVFPTPGLNPGLPHRRQILYCLSHQGMLVDKNWPFEMITLIDYHPGTKREKLVSEELFKTTELHLRTFEQ